MKAVLSYAAWINSSQDDGAWTLTAGNRHYKGVKALVTGGTGFIGSELVRQLSVHHIEVVVVDNMVNGRGWTSTGSGRHSRQRTRGRLDARHGHRVPLSMPRCAVFDSLPS